MEHTENINKDSGAPSELNVGLGAMTHFYCEVCQKYSQHFSRVLIMPIFQEYLWVET